MCTDCNEITIPTGPKGDTGSTGSTGAAGAAGSNGTNGTNGTTVLAAYTNLTGVGTPASLTETTLFTSNLPANTLATNGSELEANIYYEYFENDTVTLRIKLGSKIVALTIQSGENDIRLLKLKITRISSTSQLWTIEEIRKDALGVRNITFLQIDSSTVDLATILAFEISGQNAVATAGQIMIKKVALYKYTL